MRASLNSEDKDSQTVNFLENSGCKRIRLGDGDHGTRVHMINDPRVRAGRPVQCNGVVLRAGIVKAGI